jgi:signal transduction histidine kinase
VQIGKVDFDGRERSSTSLGLGLYIAKEIVTQHGGTIKVTSSAADGTVFSVNIEKERDGA